MSSLNFIGGEKGGVGKSVLARVLAQYFIDRELAFTGFDTDRSHTSFTRFYADYAAPVVVDTFEGLDLIGGVYELDDDPAASPEAEPPPRVIVDLAAQTAAPLARWIEEADVLGLMAELGVAVNFWHLADGGQDSVRLLDKLIDTYGTGPNYIVVRNLGRGSDFSRFDDSAALARARELGARVVTLPALQEASMNKIDHQDTSFWAAANNKAGPHALNLLERQRVKTWLKGIYAGFDSLPL